MPYHADARAGRGRLAVDRRLLNYALLVIAAPPVAVCTL